MHNATYVALGSNVAHENVSGPSLLARAVAAMQSAGLSCRKLSGVWQTAAWPPDSGQPDFVNAVVELVPHSLAPQPLYEVLSRIEGSFGRVRRERWAPRTLDLDIVAIDRLAGTFGEVVLPHPHMHERPFVLAPMAEIAPDWRHPILNRTVTEMLASARAGSPDRRLGPFPAA